MNAKPGPDSSQRTQHMSTRYYTETTQLYTVYVHLMSNKGLGTMSQSFIIVVNPCWYCCVEGLMEDKCMSNKHPR